MAKIYFDNAATTKVDKSILEQVFGKLSEGIYNPSSTHFLGRQAKSLLENNRRNIAEIVGVSSKEIVFTSGTTEANNLIFYSAIKTLNIQKIITTKIEHSSVLDPIFHYENLGKISVDFLDLDKNGNFSFNQLTDFLTHTNEPILVSLMHGNNELGNLLDLEKVANFCAKKNNVFFHSDTTQTIGHLNFKIPKGVDFATASAHKIHGLQGVGMAIFRQKISPQILGGSQEKNKRAGTENLAGIYSFSLALEKQKENDTTSLKKYFIQQISKYFPTAIFNGNLASSLSHIVSVRFDHKMTSEDLLFHLDCHKICVSIGSACSAGHETKSRVLSEILSEKELEKPSIRFSFSKYNTFAEIDFLIEALQKILC